MIAATHGSRRRGKKKGAQNNRDCVSPSQHLTDTFLCQRTQRGKKVAQKNTDCVSPSQYLMETFLYQRTLWGKTQEHTHRRQTCTVSLSQYTLSLSLAHSLSLCQIFHNTDPRVIQWECHKVPPSITDTPLCPTQRQRSNPYIGSKPLVQMFVNLYFPYAGRGLLFFDRCAVAFWIPTGVCGSGSRKQHCVKYTRMHE